jgi:hypothetical protein
MTEVRSDSLSLQPALQQRDLPKLRVPLGRQLAPGVCQKPVDISAIKHSALARPRRFQHRSHEVKKRAANIF